MHFIKLKKGYAVRFYDDGGKQQYLSGFKNKKDAEKAVIDFRERQLHEVDREITFAEYLDKWFEEYVLLNTSERTKTRYHCMIMKHIIPVLGDYKLSKLKSAHITSFYAYKKTDPNISSGTIKLMHNVIHSSLKHAVLNEYIKYNPAYAVNHPKVIQKEIVLPSDDDVRKILEYAKRSNLDVYIVIYIASVTGMRLSEILALQIENIDLQNKKINVFWNWQREKSGKLELCELKTRTSKRQIALISGTEKPIAKYLEQKKINKLKYGPKYQNNNFLVTNKYGKPLQQNACYRNLKKIIDELNKDIEEDELKLNTEITLKSFRHYHATYLLRNKVHAKIVSERLGHANITITYNIYMHIIGDMQEDALRDVRMLENFFA